MRGVLTGDGCQWGRAVAIAESDPAFMLWGTDVGGVFRSLDGGRSWEPANVGYHSRGTANLAIDPRNPRRVIAVAANSAPTDYNGLYLSDDQAGSWRQVLPIHMAASFDLRRQVAFDPSSFDPVRNRTSTVYWSRLGADVPKGGGRWGAAVNDPGFYRSDDGGESWSRIHGAEALSDAVLAVHPTKGVVYAATPRGFFRSFDRGLTWGLSLPGRATSVAVSPAAPDQVWLSQPRGLFVSLDGGDNFEEIRGARALDDGAAEDPKARTTRWIGLHNLTVSPVDPRRMVLWRCSPGFRWPRFSSADGGATWTEARILKDHVIVPTNPREGLFAMHPRDPDVILSSGGDYPTLSRDGGRTFTLAGNGVNNIYIVGGFNFSTVNPDVLLLASMDYATLLTLDGGRNWSYSEPGGKGWGGFNHSGYASTAAVLLAGESDAWGVAGRLATSHDRGKSWRITDHRLDPRFTYGDPRQPEVLFAAGLRSEDGGRSWSSMTGVTSVRTHDASTGDLWGVNGEAGDAATVVRSTDGGRSWAPVFVASRAIADLAVDHRRGRVYFVSAGRLFYWESNRGILPVTGLISDQQGPPELRSVALDPRRPETVYVAQARNRFASSASVQRSLDAGVTWENLTVNTPLDGTRRDGGREAIWVRVHPVSGEAWVATGCYGVWKHAPPEPPLP